MNIQFDWQIVDEAQEGTGPANRRGSRLKGHSVSRIVGIPSGLTKEPEGRSGALRSVFPGSLIRVQRRVQVTLARMRSGFLPDGRSESPQSHRIGGSILKRLRLAVLRRRGIRP